MKHPLTYLLPLTLSACMTFSDVEKQALADRGISDARKQSKSVHLAYLQCYALQDVNKEFCENDIRKYIKDIQAVSSWEYIHPFDYEAERIGFASFLRDRGKTCKAVSNGPKYDSAKKEYNVNCTDNHNYAMRFDFDSGRWLIVE